MRRVARHFRIGPARRSFDDPSYTYQVHAFDGNGLRPYAPAHLRATPVGEGHRIEWIRRTRLDGDSWDGAEVPLGEEREAYLVRVRRGQTVLREVDVTAPSWTYGATQQAADLAQGAVEIAVAQISARYGPGPFARMSFDAAP